MALGCISGRQGSNSAEIRIAVMRAFGSVSSMPTAGSGPAQQTDMSMCDVDADSRERTRT